MENTSALYFSPNYTHLKKSSYIYLHSYMMIYLLYYKDKDNTTGCSTTKCVSDDVFLPPLLLLVFD